MNLDPFDEYSDEQIWTCLEHAHLKSFALTLPTQLQHECGEGGRNFRFDTTKLSCFSLADHLAIAANTAG
jgi:ATP-binding cassette subfamily C (CFTR/MRP) protein 1